jgi:hypothetical protein
VYDRVLSGDIIVGPNIPSQRNRYADNPLASPVDRISLPSGGNNKGTLSAEQCREPATETREQAKRINQLTHTVVAAGCRFESFPAHHLFTMS